MTSTQIILIFLIAAWTLLTIEQWRIRRDLRRTDQWLLDVEADAGHAIIAARRAEHDAATAHSKTEWLSRTTEDIDVPEVDLATLLAHQRLVTDIPDGDEAITDSIERKA